MDSVRVRFAPSPTGHLHLGTARTAVLNWLFARRYGGTLVLRIEDTDAERSTPEFERSIVDDLRWLGLDWQEGPDAGGTVGPYRQSERLDLYRTAAAKLEDAGLVYRCYCTSDELEENRQQMLSAGKMPKYNGRCLKLSDQERGRLAEERPAALRFRVPHGEVAVHDMLRGEIHFSSDSIGDFIILRSDGSPAYNFAASVDDAAMKITHVIRGEDHLSNSARQILLYRALGEEVPGLLHLGMVLGPDGSKLSKRHGATSVDEYRREGYLADAIMNYLAILGWSDAGGEEVFRPTEMSSRFVWERLSRSGAIFDTGKLDWLNGRHIRMLSAGAIFDEAAPLLSPDMLSQRSRPWWDLLIESARDSLVTLGDLPAHASLFLEAPTYPLEAREAFQDSLAQRALRELLAHTETAHPASLEEWRQLIGQVKKEFRTQGASLRKILLPIRLALTGATSGPELPYCLALLGDETVIERLRDALALARETV